MAEGYQFWGVAVSAVGLLLAVLSVVDEGPGALSVLVPTAALVALVGSSIGLRLRRRSMRWWPPPAAPSWLSPPSTAAQRSLRQVRVAGTAAVLVLVLCLTWQGWGDRAGGVVSAWAGGSLGKGFGLFLDIVKVRRLEREHGVAIVREMQPFSNNQWYAIIRRESEAESAGR